METKHTKGNWEIEYTNEVESHLDVFLRSQDGGRAIGWLYSKSLNSYEDEFKANAKLIASAPEMLEVLIDIRNWYEENQEKYLKEYTPVCFSKALSVIQKATE